MLLFLQKQGLARIEVLLEVYTLHSELYINHLTLTAVLKGCVREYDQALRKDDISVSTVAI